jgi:cytochrome b561
MWRNSAATYGTLSKGLHWLVAVAVFGLFGLGVWMVELTYYDRWYHQAPDLHRSLGALLMIVMAARGLWMAVDGKPGALPNHRPWEIHLARLAHGLMYVLVFAIGLSGYLIATADGRPLEVFNWFSLPSSGAWFADQEDVAGDIHQWLSYSLMGLVTIHALAAFKHHLRDKDDTLKRML